MADNKGARPAARGGLCAALVRLNHLAHRLMLVIAQLSILAMIAIVTLTVVLRYCFSTGLSWAEEVPRLLVTVFAFMACAIGVRDHMHVSVDAVYNRFPAGGRMRRAMDAGADVITLLCGLFMLVSGGQRTMKLFSLPGTLPITGISTAWQYLPIPIAGFVMTFDSTLFLTGVLRRDDLLYSEPEIDFTDEAAVDRLRREGDGA
ncbi:MAG: TRAP transporter small permease [Candidatus Ventricola sp.]